MALHTSTVAVGLDGAGKGFEIVLAGGSPPTVVAPAVQGTWPPAEGWPTWGTGAPVAAGQSRQDIGGLYGPPGDWVVVVQVTGGPASGSVSVHVTYSN